MLLTFSACPSTCGWNAVENRVWLPIVWSMLPEMSGETEISVRDYGVRRPAQAREGEKDFRELLGCEALPAQSLPCVGAWSERR